MSGTKTRGYDWKLAISTGSALLGSEKNMKLNIQAAEIDASDKSNTGWGSTLAGLKKFTINVDGAYMVGDTTGWEALRDAALLGTLLPIKVRCYYDHSQLTGSAYVTNFDLDTPADGLCGGTCTINGNGALAKSTF